MRRIWLLPSAVVLLLVVLGPLMAYLGWAEPFVGFRLYLLGSLLAALSALVLGGAAAIGSALGKGWRRPAVRAATIPLLVTLIGVASMQGRNRWPFHEVSTDLENPPAFVHGPAAGAELPEEVRGAQQQLYPGLGPVRLEISPVEAFRRVEATARATPTWEVVHVDAPRGIVQAVAVTRLFHFRDDVVIRVLPEGSGARIDLRSRSRVGQSDLGANAERIQAFQESLPSGPG